MLLDISQGHKESRHNMLQNTQLVNLMVTNGGLVPIPGYDYFKTVPGGGNKIRGGENVTSLSGIILVLDENLFLLKSNNIQKLSFGQIRGTDRVKIVENYIDSIVILADGVVYEYKISTQTVSVINVGGKIVVDITYQDSRIFYQFSDNTFKVSQPGITEIYQDFTGIVSGKNTAIQSFERQIWVFTESNAELFYDTASIPNVYQKSDTFSVSYGCISPFSIAQDFGVLCWLASNKSSSLFIAVSDGGTPQFISDENIDFLLNKVKNPKNSVGYLYQLDGHTVYQIYFPDDCFGIIYDFYEKKFSKVVYRNAIENVIPFETGYIALIEGRTDIYNFGFEYTEENGSLIERYVVPVMIDGESAKSEIKKLNIAVETGQCKEGYCQLLISKDRAETFQPYETKAIAPIGNFGYFLRYRYLGMSYFWSFLIKFVVNGKFSIKYVEVN